MGAAEQEAALRLTYLALTREELVARCVSKDTAIRLMMAQLEEARGRVRQLERAVAVGRNRI